MTKELPEEVKTRLSRKLTTEEAGKRALDIFRQATERVLAKLKQSVVADVTESTKKTVVQLTEALGTKLLKMAEGWNEEIQNDLMIFPEGTRFVRRRVASQVIVVERRPEIRTLAFRGSLEKGEKDIERIYRYPLALPYVVFTLYFNQGAYQSLYVGFRNAPLMQIGDSLGRPNLPNIGEDLAVCMGQDFRNIRWDDKRVAEQINGVISEFLQSTFNHDIADEFKRMAKAQPRLSSLDAWASATRENPLFILETPWQEKHTVKALLDRCGALQPNITQQLQSEVMGVVNTVQTKLTKSLEGVEIGTVRPGELTKQFAVVLQDILTEAYSDVWSYCEGELKESEKKLRCSLDDVVRQQLEQLITLAPSYRKTLPW